MGGRYGTVFHHHDRVLPLLVTEATISRPLTQWNVEVRQFVPRERPSHLNSLRRTSECTQDHIELRLELRNSSELDAQLPFSVAKPLVDRPWRCGGGGAASNRARSGGCGGRRKCQSSHGGLLRSPRAYARGENARCAEPDTESDMSDAACAIGPTKRVCRPIQDISRAPSPVLWQQVMQ
jgi:hypothetical protein